MQQCTGGETSMKEILKYQNILTSCDCKYKYNAVFKFHENGNEVYEL